MDIGVIEAVYATVLVVIVGFVVLIAWVKRRGLLGQYMQGDPSRPVYHTVANGFLALQQIFEPDKRHILEVRLEEQTEADDEGGPDRAGRKKRRRRRR